MLLRKAPVKQRIVSRPNMCLRKKFGALREFLTNQMASDLTCAPTKLKKLDELAEAATPGQKAGFDEINLNVGCPSDRVQSGAFEPARWPDQNWLLAASPACRAWISR